MVYLKRLFKAIAYGTLGVLYIFRDWDVFFENWAKGQEGFALNMILFAKFVADVASLIFLVKSAYYFMTFHIEDHPCDSVRDRWFAEGVPCSDEKETNLEKIVEYRKSKLSGMSNSDALKEYKKTAWVDGMLMSDNSSTHRGMRNYLDSKLAGMTNEQGYMWLKDMG
ncbi:MAG: hypothetical protein WC466_03280 [Candidatus Izemoplasmatales bacterium]